jgi:hypothetical protein
MYMGFKLQEHLVSCQEYCTKSMHGQKNSHQFRIPQQSTSLIFVRNNAGGLKMEKRKTTFISVSAELKYLSLRNLSKNLYFGVLYSNVSFFLQ